MIILYMMQMMKSFLQWLEENPIQSTLLPFSLTKVIENGAYYKDNNIYITLNNKQIIMPTANLTLRRKPQY